MLSAFYLLLRLKSSSCLQSLPFLCITIPNYWQWRNVTVTIIEKVLFIQIIRKFFSRQITRLKCNNNFIYLSFILLLFISRYSGSLLYSNPITSYSSPFAGDISGHSSYPNIDPYSAYHDSTIHSDIPSYAFDHDHHDHHDHHDYRHEHDYHHDHHHDFDHFTDHISSHDAPPAGGGSAQSAIDDPNSSGGSPPAMSATYRRVGKHRRRRAAKPQVE